jgi:hypothetical protein
MATLTIWEADNGGYFQGTATPGQVVGRLIDWALDKIGKLPKLPKIEPNQDHWTTWPEGQPMEVTDDWLKKMIGAGRLPDLGQGGYLGNYEERAQARVITGTHVFVELLDTARKTRHRCLLGRTNVLIASKEAWDASLNAA